MGENELIKNGTDHVDDGRRDVIVGAICGQVAELYLAELIQVADFIKSVRAARKYMVGA